MVESTTKDETREIKSPARRTVLLVFYTNDAKRRIIGTLCYSYQLRVLWLVTHLI